MALGCGGCGVSLGPDVSTSDSVLVLEDQALIDATPQDRDADSSADVNDVEGPDADSVTAIPMQLSLVNYGPVLFARYPDGLRWVGQAEFFGPMTGSRSRPFPGCVINRVRNRAPMLNPQNAQITVNGRSHSLIGGSIGWAYSELSGVPLTSGTRATFAVRGGNVGTIDAEVTVPTAPTMTSPVGVGMVNTVSYRPQESLIVRWTPEDTGEVVLRLRAPVVDDQVELRCFVSRAVGSFEITPAHWHTLGDNVEIDFTFSGVIRQVLNGVEVEGRTNNDKVRFRREP